MSLPSAITELIEEYKDNTLRVPKDVKSVNFVIDNESRIETIEVPISSGVWVIESSDNITVSVLVSIIIRKVGYTPTVPIQVPLRAQSSHDASNMKNMTICMEDKPLFSIRIAPLIPIPTIYHSDNLIGMFFLSHNSQARRILGQLIFQDIQSKYPKYSMRSADEGEEPGLLLTDISTDNIKQYIPDIELKKKERTDLQEYGAEIGLWGDIDRFDLDIGGGESGRWGEDTNNLAPDIREINRLAGIYLSIHEEDEEDEGRGQTSADIMIENPRILQAYVTINEGLKRGLKSATDFQHLRPLI